MAKFSHIVVGVFFLGIGLAGAIGSRALTFWAKGLPGPGFFPMTLSCVVIFCSIAILLPSLRTAGDLNINVPAIKKMAIFLAALTLFSVFLSHIIGFLVALTIFYIMTLRLWKNIPLGRAILNGLVCSTTLYVIFILWLGVDMPIGYFHDFLTQ